MLDQKQQPRTVTVVGLGAMGGRAAEALTRRFAVRGFDPMPSARERAANAGVFVFESLQDAADGADVVLLSLPTPKHVHQVVTELREILTNALVIDMSTIDPTAAQEAAAILREAGSAYVDAPILGRPDACGNWLMPVGGNASDVAIMESLVVGTIAKGVEHVGAVGTGSTLKILNNLMLGAINTVTAESIRLAEASGLDPKRFVSVVKDSGAASVSPLFREVAPKMASGEFSPTFSVELLLKDITLANQLADAANIDAPIAREVQAITQAAFDRGLGDLDTSAVIQVYRGTSPQQHPLSPL